MPNTGTITKWHTTRVLFREAEDRHVPVCNYRNKADSSQWAILNGSVNKQKINQAIALNIMIPTSKLRFIIIVNFLRNKMECNGTVKGCWDAKVAGEEPN